MNQWGKLVNWNVRALFSCVSSQDGYHMVSHHTCVTCKWSNPRENKHPLVQSGIESKKQICWAKRGTEQCPKKRTYIPRGNRGLAYFPTLGWFCFVHVNMPYMDPLEYMTSTICSWKSSRYLARNRKTTTAIGHHWRALGEAARERYRQWREGTAFQSSLGNGKTWDLKTSPIFLFVRRGSSKGHPFLGVESFLNTNPG